MSTDRLRESFIKLRESLARLSTAVYQLRQVVEHSLPPGTRWLLRQQVTLPPDGKRWMQRRHPFVSWDGSDR